MIYTQFVSPPFLPTTTATSVVVADVVGGVAVLFSSDLEKRTENFSMKRKKSEIFRPFARYNILE